MNTPSTNAQSAPTTEQGGMSAGLKIGIVFAIILVGLCIALAILYFQGKKSATSVPTFNMPDLSTIDYVTVKVNIGDKWYQLCSCPSCIPGQPYGLRMVPYDGTVDATDGTKLTAQDIDKKDPYGAFKFRLKPISGGKFTLRRFDAPEDHELYGSAYMNGSGFVVIPTAPPVADRRPMPPVPTPTLVPNYLEHRLTLSILGMDKVGTETLYKVMFNFNRDVVAIRNDDLSPLISADTISVFYMNFVKK